jgi:NADPH:quinone reductase-like Zn-dependent oxidoreductase
MKAVQINTYGGTEVIEVTNDAVKPTLKTGQVLVENRAASINPIDWKIRMGYLQKMAPVPVPITLGGDLAGTVVEVGTGVNDFKVGDEVYGQAIILNGGSGSMADFVAVNTANVSIKPKGISFEEAAALPLAGASALQAIDKHIQLEEGEKILIHGGAGGIGHLAIQIAKALGGYVATTVSAKDKAFVEGLGADEVIDYRTEKFEEKLKDFDAVYDTVGGETTEKSFLILKRGGTLVSMLGAPSQELADKYGVKVVGQGTVTNTDQLVRLAELVEKQKIKVNVDKIFSLDEAKAAFEYQENVHPRGKVVLRVK